MSGLAFPREFGAYTILGELGRGSMGVVYEASRAGQRMALKVMRMGLGSDRGGLDRFEREAKVAASLPHDHIVRTLETGEAEGEVFFTMPLLPGQSLSGVVREIKSGGDANAVLDRCGISPCLRGEEGETTFARRIAGALVGVADALAGLHDRGMIHRDVKPSNLMLDSDGRVLLADFGLVRMSGQRLTETGQILGTLLYMSPEQLIAGPGELDGRADVYSLGATLFELLTLRPPLHGRDARETLALILERRPPSLRALCPGLPREVEAIVSRTLEKRPDDRYADMRSLRDDLAAFAAAGEVRIKPLGWAARVVRRFARR